MEERGGGTGLFERLYFLVVGIRAFGGLLLLLGDLQVVTAGFSLSRDLGGMGGVACRFGAFGRRR